MNALRRIGGTVVNLASVVLSLFAAVMCGAFGVQQPGAVLAFVLPAAALHWLGWRLGYKPIKSALLRRCAQFAAALAIFGALGLVNTYGTPSFAAQLVLTLAAAAAVSLLCLRYLTLTRTTKEKPEPESWQTASSIIYEHGASFGFGMSLMGVLALWPIIGAFACFQFVPSLAGRVSVAWLWPAVGLQVVNLLVVTRWFMPAYRAALRSRFSDKPYIWADASGLSVRSRAFVPWKDIKQIDAIWQSSRGRRRFQTGAYVLTERALDGYLVAVPLQNATIDCEEAVEAMRAMAARYGCPLPDRSMMFASVLWHDRRYAEVAVERSTRSAALRKATSETMASVAASNEKSLAGLPAEKARYEDQIARNRMLKVTIESQLTRMEAQGADPEKIARHREHSASLDRNLASLQGLIASLPDRERQLLETRQKMRDRKVG
jgi:hypothetical protein